MTGCRACKAPLLWVVMTGTGKKNPLDVQPAALGNVRLTGQYQGDAPIAGAVTKASPAQPGEKLYVSHFATCPKASRFKAGRR